MAAERKKPQHFTIHLAPTAATGWVELDGVRLTSLRAIRIASAVNEETTVSCDFINVTVDGDAETDA